jgi:hypothetical protein
VANTPREITVYVRATLEIDTRAANALLVAFVDWYEDAYTGIGTAETLAGQFLQFLDGEADPNGSPTIHATDR